MLVKRIAAERRIPVDAITVFDVQQFPMNRWGDTGAIEVVYDPAGYHALYGFDSLARVNIYAD